MVCRSHREREGEGNALRCQSSPAAYDIRRRAAHGEARRIQRVVPEDDTGTAKTAIATTCFIYRLEIEGDKQRRGIRSTRWCRCRALKCEVRHISVRRCSPQRNGEHYDCRGN